MGVTHSVSNGEERRNSCLKAESKCLRWELGNYVVIQGLLYIPEMGVRKLPSQCVTGYYLYIESVVCAHNKCGARV
jgi:hypothetical protein